MPGKLILYSCLLLSTATFLLTASAMAIQVYNDDTSFKESHKSNFNFLVFLLVCAICCVLMSFGGLYFGASSGA